MGQKPRFLRDSLEREADSLGIPWRDRSLRDSLGRERETERFLKDCLERDTERGSHLVGGDADGGRFPTSLGVALP